MNTEVKKYISIVGDSVSTFEGHTPKDDSRPIYSTETRGASKVYRAEDTWWLSLISRLNGALLSNQSYLASGVSRYSYQSASFELRAKRLAKDGIDPDLVLISIGLNDVAGYVDEVEFEEDYATMLRNIQSRYPQATVVCSTLVRGRLPHANACEFINFDARYPLERYNRGIRAASTACGCQVADFAAMEASYATIDGVHPNKEGMLELADLWYHCLTANGDTPV